MLLVRLEFISLVYFRDDARTPTDLEPFCFDLEV